MRPRGDGVSKVRVAPMPHERQGSSTMSDSSEPAWPLVGAEAALEGHLRAHLETLGVHRAMELAPTSLDRRCVEAIHLVLADGDGTPGYVHAGFAMTALPHKRTDALEWVRDGADIRLRI